MESSDESREGFRDRLYTIDESGKRLWVFAKKPGGRLTRARNITGVLLMIFFFTAPFIRVDGEQFLLFNFLERKFVLFGAMFWPQDFNIFFVAMIAVIVFILLFTVTYGRLWCGWACPQTVFMEVLFRRIEYWIDGDAGSQRALAARPWDAAKIARRVLKHGVFFILSFVISNYFLMYIIGTDAWLLLVTDNPGEHLVGLSGMVVFSFIFYFIFSWFREQVCTIVCPYGRLQGVLLDRSTVVISYDHPRGEPRGFLRKGENRSETGKGDCVDCHQCVSVCPTGIDIRNGTQLECINCACCIDACNDVMKRSGFRPGLIRYASERMITDRKPWRFTVRSAGYTIVLAALVSVLTWLLVSRSPVEATVLRTQGMLYQEQEGGKLSNLYNLKLVNKTGRDMPVEIRDLSGKGEIRVIGGLSVVPAKSLGEIVFFLVLDRSALTSKHTDIQIGVFSGGKLLDQTETSFLGPDK